jgi:hypothetical protein
MPEFHLRIRIIPAQLRGQRLSDLSAVATGNAKAKGTGQKAKEKSHRSILQKANVTPP